MELVELGTHPGPAALGHDPVILPEQRENLLEAIEGTGAVRFRDDPVFPWLNTG